LGAKEISLDVNLLLKRTLGVATAWANGKGARSIDGFLNGIFPALWANIEHKRIPSHTSNKKGAS
jgi:hypothetical protein